MKDLLIEIGVEEMPPSAIAIALDFVKGELSSVLRRDDIETYATPRRLAFYVRNFENGVEREERVVVGPPWSGAFDREGKPTPALEGFLRRVGASVRDVFKYKKGKGEYVAVRTVEKERTYLDILRTRFEEIILSVPFPKRMRWTSSKSLTFSRPIRWLLALYGEEVIDLRVGSLRSGRRTRGHRFLSKGWVEVHLASDYLRVMEENKVIPDVEVRRRMIKEGIEELARREGGEVVIPEGLLDEVTYLVEYPFPVLGRFEERFLELPDRVIITVAAHHQRFFCISKEGKLTNAFIGVSNNEPADDSVKRGYERVLRARLEDALFFYREDLKKDLDSLVPKLSGVLIHPKVGTALEKVERLKRIIGIFCEALSITGEQKEKALRAAHLSKADLLTEMVKELDELQGYMGYIYALEMGEEKEVALALWEQYGDTPSTISGALLSLADKLDDLLSFFKAGEVPTGGSDPYGLRKAAFGVFRVLESRNWDIDITSLAPIYESPETFERVGEFLSQRLASYLEDYGYDIVRAVLSSHSPLKPLSIIKKVKYLSQERNTEEFALVCEAYRRVVRILPEGWNRSSVREELLREKEEVELWKALREIEKKGEPSLEALASLKGFIDDLFSNVLIMDRDERVRENRLSLLKRVELLFKKVADFGEIVRSDGKG